jgi:ribosomal protein L40E
MRVLGGIVVALGLVLTVIGSVSLFSSWRTIGSSHYYWAAFLGLPLIAVGSAFTHSESLGVHDVNLSGEMTPVATNLGTRDDFAVPCARCQATNPTHANFCNQCGTSLSDPTCLGCGARITRNARFCTQCGKSLV